MSAAIQEKTDTADREISLTRTFDAPRELVYRMFTEAEHVTHWWGPRGFRTQVHSMDARPGGRWSLTMTGPDGTVFPNEIVFDELVRPSRIKFHHPGGPGHITTIDLTEKDGKTEVFFHMLFPTAAVRQMVVEKFGAIQGLSDTLGKLGKYLAARAAQKDDLVITRTFAAPLDAVAKMFTDLQHVASWWGPKHFKSVVHEWDARPNGKIRLDMHAPDGVVYPMGGRFHEVEHGRIVFTASALDAEGNAVLENHNTITLEEKSGKTTLTLRVHVIGLTPAAALYLQGMSQGWSQSLDRLEQALSSKEMNMGSEFVIARTFDAPRDLVWKAWTERDNLAKWFGPKGMNIVKSDLDFRVGGTYHYGLQPPGGDVFYGLWQFREITPPKELVFLSSFSDANRGLARHPMAPTWPLEMLSRITFEEPSPGQTTVTVRWSALNATPAEQQAFDNAHASMNGGWSGTFEQLAAYLASAK